MPRHLRARLSELIAQDHPSADDLVALFDDAPPVDLAFVIGDWAGALFVKRGRMYELLAAANWVGKNFRAADDVDPIVVTDASGNRVASDVAGTAHLEMSEYRGALTATMVYDSRPIRDHFHRIDADTLIGAMEMDGAPAPGFFYLARLPSSILFR